MVTYGNGADADRNWFIGSRWESRWRSCADVGQVVVAVALVGTLALWQWGSRSWDTKLATSFAEVARVLLSGV